MKLNNLKPAEEPLKGSKRVGRGQRFQLGKPPGEDKVRSPEAAAEPDPVLKAVRCLFRRLPKRGFTNKFKSNRHRKHFGS